MFNNNAPNLSNNPDCNTSSPSPKSMLSTLPPVLVGKTSYPLKSNADLKGVISHFDNAQVYKEKFNLLDGPPYANGAPHLGHVLNKHIKDALARSANLLGHDVSWRPGWDCHGLPLELLVEAQGFDRFDKSNFAKAARQFAQSQVDLQSEVFQNQGWCASWDNPYKTMDHEMEAGTMRVLADLLDKGVVETRFTSVPWCGKCQSTLSGAESEDKDVSQTSWLVPFHLSENECFLSWTTTPWTLPLHKNLVLNPDATYASMEKDGYVAWVSEDTLDKWADLLDAKTTDNTKKGLEFKDAKYSTPWLEGTVCVDDLVLPQAGTGVLHAVPGLSDLDTKLGHKNGWVMGDHLCVSGLVQNSPLESENGLYASNKASLSVMPFYESSVWFKTLDNTVSMPHCWRHKTALLTRPSRQVFLSLSQQTRDFALKMVDEVAFTPLSSKNRLLASMRTRPDWCVSRQRSWGVPMALFLDKSTGQPHANASMWSREVADKVQVEGLEAWWNSSTKYWVGSQFEDQVDRVDDVLDVWFDSGCVPQLVTRADVVVEGTDQHRGWFQSCLWVAALLNSEDNHPVNTDNEKLSHLQSSLPFKRVVTHGFVVDSTGQKLSKSKGGDSAQKGQKAPSWDTLPSDVVRLWSLMGSEGSDKLWSADSVTLANSASSRLRGVMRFLLANQLDDNPSSFDPNSLPAWDKYWWNKLEMMHDKTLSLVMSGHTGEALSALLPFSEEYSSTLLGSWKDRLYCSSSNNLSRQQLDHLLKSHLYLWHRVLQVFTPRLCLEAQLFMPLLSFNKAPFVDDKQKQEVESVLSAKNNLGPVMESLAKQKTPPSHRRLVWPNAPLWSDQLLADALDVGEVSFDTQNLEHVHLDGEDFYVGKSPNQVCPRCRRSQEVFVDDVCSFCVDNCK